MDPLSLLRDFTIAKRQVVVEGDEIAFGDRRFGAETLTNYRSKTGEFYPLNALVLFIQYADASVTDYLRATQNAKVPFIKTVDKGDLLAYLRGKSDSSLQVQIGVPAQHANREQSAKHQRVGEVSGVTEGPEGLSARTIRLARRKHAAHLQTLAALRHARCRHSWRSAPDLSSTSSEANGQAKPRSDIWATSVGPTPAFFDK
eukprot:CAMPEP_0113947804 /NCGR_PEP_ID=MMETSP1339-20121228/66788_1 /TAXON_ID=94617 /ORGANISM="Fibrocapsa japonica" /LENGTH=201 /DNA_ID=CAMNT_0000954545 /DNA_START=40 /DNA_END=642 /DNA_ORIENTATION=+ /assembly_acc=CAM_ASM_000762